MHTLSLIVTSLSSFISNVYWIDTAIPLEKFLQLKHYQVQPTTSLWPSRLVSLTVYTRQINFLVIFFLPIDRCQNPYKIPTFLFALTLQRINHFPGMGEICRKDSLARNILKYVITNAQLGINVKKMSDFYNHLQDESSSQGGVSLCSSHVGTARRVQHPLLPHSRVETETET